MVRFTDVEQKSARRQAQAQTGLGARANYNEAEANYRARRRDLRAQVWWRKADYDQALARRDAAQAALNAAAGQLSEVGQKLDYTTVRAPYDGHRHQALGAGGRGGAAGPARWLSGVSLKQLRVSVQVPQSAVGGDPEGPPAREILLATASA